MYPFVVDQVVQYESCPRVLYADVVDGLLGVALGDLRSHLRVLIGGLKSPQCCRGSVKVMPTHKMECLLVFPFFLVISQGDGLSPVIQTRNSVGV